MKLTEMATLAQRPTAAPVAVVSVATSGNQRKANLRLLKITLRGNAPEATSPQRRRLRRLLVIGQPRLPLTLTRGIVPQVQF